MTPYAELLEFNQPNPIRLQGFTRIRDQFRGLSDEKPWYRPESGSDFEDGFFYDPERIIEFAGGWDYGENNAMKTGTRDKSIIERWIASGEQSMIEMGHATFFLECSRVVSHELVRHRLASYQQESQRFVNYKELSIEDFYFPPELEMWKWPDDVDFQGDPQTPLESVKAAYELAVWAYRNQQTNGIAKQLARYVLPNAMKTRLVMSANTREWRHILQLRMDKSAQPEMQQLMQQVYDQLVMVFPQSLSGVLDNGRGIR